MSIADQIAAQLKDHERFPSRENGGPITVEGHRGAFTPDELKRISRELPAVFVSFTATTDPKASGLQTASELHTPCVINFDLIATGPHKAQGSQPSRGDIVEALLFAVLKILGLWTTVPGSTSEVSPVYCLAGMGKPMGVTSRNVYSTALDKKLITWWRVSYTANYEHPGPDIGDYFDWDLLHAEHPKDDWRDGVVVDPGDPILTTETDMSP